MSTSFAQLKAFYTVVEQGSLAKAARALSMAPPSLSKSLRLLEKNIGLSLFDRSSNKLVLTEAGQLLYQSSKPHTQQLEHAIARVQDLDSEPSGSVRISLPRLAHQMIFGRLFAEFCRLYPQIQLEISLNDATIDIVEEGFDFGIRFGDRVSLGMVAKPLTGNLTEAVFASPEYIAKHGMPQTLEELAQHKVVQYRYIASNQLVAFKLMQEGQEVSLELSPAIIVNDTDLVIDGALQHLGIGRMLAPLVAPHFAKGTLLPVLKSHWYDYPGLYLYYPQHNRQFKRLRVFIDYLTKNLSQSVKPATSGTS
ncbi:LysR family transcriptional regulator [Paraferrimonas haliotis]|uniref:LysR family transcriptional regulator n=1 Tax=Paraferrimonas haliotis TaxID=2013866 RepID=A0AA37TSJ5_9GAMM|nr:LysR family transcriptional regulator [Paraferrimonas haliotis]GLS82329.1 LysR family transcriptional regulator [Paraferrimonas haliotis]